MIRLDFICKLLTPKAGQKIMLIIIGGIILYKDTEQEEERCDVIIEQYEIYESVFRRWLIRNLEIDYFWRLRLKPITQRLLWGKRTWSESLLEIFLTSLQITVEWERVRAGNCQDIVRFMEISDSWTYKVVDRLRYK